MLCILDHQKSMALIRYHTVHRKTSESSPATNHENPTKFFGELINNPPLMLETHR